MQKIIILLITCTVALATVICPSNCCGSLSTRPAQTYTFYQNTGAFIGGSGQWAVNTKGYSGQGQGYLNPSMQCVVNTGPLPANTYKLTSCVNSMHSPPVNRPCSFVLTPQDQSKMCGRSDFLIHGCQCCTDGDTTAPPVNGCSAGCVVIDIQNRELLRVGDTLIVKQYQNSEDSSDQDPSTQAQVDPQNLE